MKLSPGCYSLFKVPEKVGTTAYRLDLPVDSRIHPVFHESCLRGKWGKRHQLVVNLSLTDKEEVLKSEPEEVLERRMKKKKKGRAVMEPEEILERRRKKKKGCAVTELLSKWRDLGAEEAFRVEYVELERVVSRPCGQGL